MALLYEPLDLTTVKLLFAGTFIVMISIILIIFAFMLLAGVSVAIVDAFRGKKNKPLEEEVAEKEEEIEAEETEEIEEAEELDNVLILDEEMERLQRIIFDDKKEELIKALEKRSIKVPQGYILHDQSGCDSAKILRAIAGKAKNSFVNFSVDKCKELFRSRKYEDAKNSIEKVFEKAKKKAPCIIFIDEIDLACEEGSQDGTINGLITKKLLSEMEKLKSHKNVAVVARASHPEILDSKLVKYLPESIKIDLPNSELRKKALKRYIDNDEVKPSLSEEDLKKFAEGSGGMSISDIMHLADKVKFHAMEDKKSSITLDEIQDELEKLKDEKRNRENAVIEKNSKLGKDKNTFEIIKRDENGPKLADVVVSEEVRNELKMICNQISGVFKTILEKLDYKQNKGYILYGPPGTGKTMIARAIANESNYAFISISGSDFDKNFSGQGACFAGDLFEAAKKNSPCIIFMDEIDSIGRKRGQDSSGGSQERDATLNQMLNKMDGLLKLKGVIVMAATNRLGILDPALTRPGRFDRHIEIGLPNEGEREQILNLYMKNVPRAEGLDLQEIAKLTKGFSGADLAELVNRAKCYAAKRLAQGNSDQEISIAKDDFLMALEDLKAQKEKSAETSAKTRVPETQMELIELLKYLSRIPAMQAAMAQQPLATIGGSRSIAS